jgi:DNA-binding NarL/FixJ family response regulator
MWCSMSSMLILIADPEKGARELAAEALRRAGYATLEANSGEEAVEIARRERPRVVVLEVSLPEICGYEVCRQLKEEFGERLSIVFVSATRNEPHDRVGGLLLGADDYLAKPFDGDELAARVRRLAERATPLDSEVASDLTPREREILGLLAQGLDQSEIAGRLFITAKTVGTHIEHVLGKLGVRSRAQAVARAYQRNLVDTKPFHFHSSGILALLLSRDGFLLDWLSACGGWAC